MARPVKQREVRVCKGCGQTFEALPSDDRKYCLDTCYQQHSKQPKGHIIPMPVAHPPAPVQAPVQKPAAIAPVQVRASSWWQQLWMSSEEKDDLHFKAMNAPDLWRAAERLYEKELQKAQRGKLKKLLTRGVPIGLALASAYEIGSYFASGALTHGSLIDQAGVIAAGIAGLLFEIGKIACVFNVEELKVRVLSMANRRGEKRTVVDGETEKVAQWKEQNVQQAKLWWLVGLIALVWLVAAVFSVMFQYTFLVTAGNAVGGLTAARAVALAVWGDVMAAIGMSIPPKSALEVASTVASRYEGTAHIGRALIARQQEYNAFCAEFHNGGEK